MYRAQKVRSFHRDGWCLSFQHPLKQGRRVKRWMNTRDDQEMDRLVQEMNALLLEKEDWMPQARVRVAARYDARVVSAFYDDVFVSSPSVVQDEYVSLPARESYRRVAFAGEKGAGKTALIRRMLSLTQDERFPATAVVNPFRPCVQYVTSHQPEFEVVLTFKQRARVQRDVEKLIAEAAYEYASGGTDQELIYTLFHRLDASLSYVLGSLPVTLPYTGQTLPGKTSIHGALLEDVEQIQTEALTIAEALGKQELETQFFDKWNERMECHQIVETLMNRIESMLFLVKAGTWTFTDDDWPLAWSHKAQDRSALFHTIERLTTYQREKYEGTLTPFIESVRVKGPFQQELSLVMEEIQEHDFSLTNIEALRQCDVIVFVQDMSEPLSASLVKQLLVNGQGNKLMLCLTHEDRLYGGTKSQRTSYMMDHVKEMLTEIERDLGCYAKQIVERSLTQNGIYVFRNLHSAIEDPHTTALCHTFIQALKHERNHDEEPATPLYVNMMVPLAIDRGIASFYEKWNKQTWHWRELQALCFAMSMPEKEAKGNPATVFCADMQTHVYTLFFTQPSGWSRPHVTQQAKEQAIERIMTRFSQKLQAYAEGRLHRRNEWKQAYEEKSIAEREKRVQHLLHEAFPQPTDTNYPAFLKDIYSLVKQTVEEEEGVLLS
ncbi:hypothetical protein [Metabacillus iocasae]|uniref:ATP-binding protein n=1 Tax=Priestia iocasae TaxID=2291674 RepID=A0ABS2QUT1_9BACI|nr:hypothetical protein [Metabacillus iocasae]MBM7702259.1 hypothetical protein [Metabacillus iocasae]